MDSLHSTDTAVDNVVQLVLIMLYKQLIPDIASLRDAEVHARTQARKKALTDKLDKVNPCKAAAATAPCT